MLIHAIAQWGRTDTVRESALKVDSWGEKNPMPHRGIEPESAACRSDALTTELHAHLVQYIQQNQAVSAAGAEVPRGCGG